MEGNILSKKDYNIIKENYKSMESLYPEIKILINSIPNIDFDLFEKLIFTLEFFSKKILEIMGK